MTHTTLKADLTRTILLSVIENNEVHQPLHAHLLAVAGLGRLVWDTLPQPVELEHPIKTEIIKNITKLYIIHSFTMM